MYPNQMSVKFQMLQSWIVIPHRLKSLVLATRKVKWCKLYHYFNKQSSLKSLPIKIIHFPSSLQNFGKNVNIVQVVHNFIWGLYMSSMIAHLVQKIWPILEFFF